MTHNMAARDQGLHISCVYHYERKHAAGYVGSIHQNHDVRPCVRSVNTTHTEQVFEFLRSPYAMSFTQVNFFRKCTICATTLPSVFVTPHPEIRVDVDWLHTIPTSARMCGSTAQVGNCGTVGQHGTTIFQQKNVVLSRTLAYERPFDTRQHLSLIRFGT